MLKMPSRQNLMNRGALVEMEERPRVLRHVFSAIEIDRIGVAGFVLIGIAVDFADVDEAFAVSFDKDVIGPDAF